MNQKIRKCMVQLGILLVAVALMTGPSLAAEVTVDLAAVESQWTPPEGGTPIPMWEFVAVDDPATFTCPAIPVVWGGGHRIVDPDGNNLLAGDTLTINLYNCLPEAEPVSIMIPTQHKPLAPVPVGGRVRSFDKETLTGPESYRWINLKAGTHIYHSATSLAKQVPMGLYGALMVDAATGEAYPGVAFDHEVVLFYSEVDPALRDPAAFAHPNDYDPRYFMVNGQVFEETVPITIPAGAPGQRTLVRFLSAALDEVVPTINGLHWDIVAEDGNRYPYPKTQYTAQISPLKTKDAILVPSDTGTYAVFDRMLNLTNAGNSYGGMIAKLEVTAGVGTPTVAITAPPDGASFYSGDEVTFTGTAVDPTDGDISAELAWTTDNPPVDPPVSIGVGASVSIDTLFQGPHTITASVDDGAGGLVIDSITIQIGPANTAPTVEITAPADGSSFNAGDTITFSGTATDTEDGDLSAGIAWSSDIDGAIGTGASVLTNAISAGEHIITATVTDSGGLPNAATITLTVNAVNQPPVAVDDRDQTTRNVAKTINLTANDSDPDGDLDPTTLTLTVPESDVTGVYLTTRGGTVTSLGNGSVVFTPKNNFKGTDTFTYVVYDSNDQVSNEATVRVDVVK